MGQILQIINCTQWSYSQFKWWLVEKKANTTKSFVDIHQHDGDDEQEKHAALTRQRNKQSILEKECFFSKNNP